MKPILNNFIGGLKLALMIKCRYEEFKISWGALWAGSILILATHFLIDFFAVKIHDGFNQWAFYFHALGFFLIMFSSYLVGLNTKNTNKILRVSVIFYSSLWIIYCIAFILNAWSPEWLSGNIQKNIYLLLTIWSFLIAFRVLELCYDITASKQIFSSIIMASAFFIPLNYTYIGKFYYYYNYEENSEENSEHAEFWALSDEEIFSYQRHVLSKQLQTLSSSEEGNIDLYGIVFGSYSHQDVFMREVKFVKETIDTTLKTSNRTLSMINNPETFKDTPLANSTNLTTALTHIGQIMQPEEDILLIYLTSHGNKESGITVSLGGGHSFLNLSAGLLKEILDASGIKNKIIFISACFSGAMIDTIKDDNMMIITSAAKNKSSFGCSDDAPLTFFADAYFKQALIETTNLEKAFDIAKEIISNREIEEDLSPPSNPQIFIGKNIKQVLEKYKGAELVETK